MQTQTYQWTEEEDATLTLLYEQRHVQDWSEIARILTEEYDFPVRLPKHCKDREFVYKQKIYDESVELCSVEDIMDLARVRKVHVVAELDWEEMGDDSSTFAGKVYLFKNNRTDNCVKNHFYSKLRKLLRKLNKIIQFYLKKQFRPIDISVMYKIVEAAEERFKEKPNCEGWVSEECHNVENKMLEFAMFRDEGEGEGDGEKGDGKGSKNDKEEELKFSETSIDEYRGLISEIYRVSKLYKRKSKKVRNSLIQAPVNHAKKKGKKEVVKAEEKEDQSGSSEQLYEPKQRVPTTILVRKHNDRVDRSDPHPLTSIQHERPQPNTRIQVEEGEGIQALLRTAGILHDEIKPSTSRGETHPRKSSILSQFSGMNMPSPLMNPSQQSFIANSSAEYSPLHSFSSHHQMENFLGFPMVNNNNNNNYVNFTLSEKSSFKSYSERDPSEIENPFFDDYSSNNDRMMFPMNFNLPVSHQYQQQGLGDQGFGNFQYGNVYYQGQGQDQEDGESFVGEPKGN